QWIGHFGVLVEASRHAYRIRKVEPERAHGEGRIVPRELDVRRQLERSDREPMGVLRIKQPENRPHERLDQADHSNGSGNTCRPSPPSKSDFAHSTALSGNTP